MTILVCLDNLRVTSDGDRLHLPDGSIGSAQGEIREIRAVLLLSPSECLTIGAFKVAGYKGMFESASGVI